MSKRLRFWIAAARRRFVPGAARRTASRLLDHRISPGATCRARPKRRRAAALQTGGCRLEGGIDYIYDGKRVIQERDTNNTPTVSYTRGNDLSGSLEGAGGIGGLLERADGYNPTNGSWANHNYYHADGNGNVTYLESDSQTLAASYRYDAYGNTLASSGTLAVSNTYRFSSKEFIPTAGLYYYLYRFYDPTLQRWINRDPIQEIGGINLYCSMQNNIVNYNDPNGLLLAALTSLATTAAEIALDNCKSCACVAAATAAGIAAIQAGFIADMITDAPTGFGALITTAAYLAELGKFTHDAGQAAQNCKKNSNCPNPPPPPTPPHKDPPAPVNPPIWT